jgi:hypothetical protein
MIELLVSLLIAGLVLYLLFWFVDNILQLPANMNQVVKVVVSVLALIWLLQRLMPSLGI